MPRNPILNGTNESDRIRGIVPWWDEFSRKLKQCYSSKTSSEAIYKAYKCDVEARAGFSAASVCALTESKKRRRFMLKLKSFCDSNTITYFSTPVRGYHLYIEEKTPDTIQRQSARLVKAKASTKQKIKH